MVAGLSIVLAIIWLFPFSGSFIHYPVDFFISIMWFVAFGLLVNYINGGCGYIFDWAGITLNGNNTCPEWKADIAFCFLSALMWLVSALLGVYWVHRHNRSSTTAAPTGGNFRRRKWYRSRV